MFSAPVKSSAVIRSNNVQVQGSCSEVGSSCSKVDTSDSIFSVMSATAGFPSSLDGGNPSSGSNKFTKSKRPTGGQVYICDVEGCGRTFTSIGYMKYHQGVHSGQRDLKCEFEGCDRKFAWPAHLKYHLMTHTGSRLYKCSVNGCSKSFYTSQRLNVHKRTHTGERPFLCTEEGCDRSFTTAGNLKNHLRVHTGDRPFVCPSDGCGKRFAEQSSLKKHSLVHTGEKPFVCKLCGRTFSQSGSRNVHMKRRHSDQLSDDFGDEEFDDSPGFEIHVEEQDPSFCSDQRVLILHRSEEDLLQIKDEDSTTEEDTPSSDAVMSQSNANVIVLAQPQDILGMANGYHFADADVQEEIVFGDTTTLPSGLDPDQFIRPHHH